MRAILIAIGFGIAAFAGEEATAAQLRYGLFTFLTPAAATDLVDGNDATRVPFGDFTDSRDAGLGRVRYQQVVAASEFPGLPSEGVNVLYVAFRSDACLRAFNSSTSVSNFTVRLSTTTRSPDGLSADLSANSGSDSRLILAAESRGFADSGGFCAPEFPVTPAGPNNSVFFFLNSSTPFFYSPKRGNLLVEIAYSGADYMRPGSAGAVMDAANSLEDGVSRAWEWSDAKGVHSNADSLGLVMYVGFVHPKIEFTRNGNDLLLEWAGPNYLPDFRLQVTSSLQPGAQWVDFSGPVDTSSTAVYRAKLSLPTQGKSQPRYFRLYSDKVSPAPPSDE